MISSLVSTAIPYQTYSGCGNSFVLIDNRTGSFSRALEEITSLTSKEGCDGLITLECSRRADIKMRIFNRDGSEAEMCGNGIRCLLRFLLELGFPKRRYTVETMNDLLSGEFVGEEICIQMSLPKIHALSEELEGRTVHFIDTGVPHAVLFVDSLDNISEVGRLYRSHAFFGPAGTNVTFVQHKSGSSLHFTTFERGVEAETLACGTGATAAALITHLTRQIPGPIETFNKRGDRLIIDFKRTLSSFSQVTMTGPAIKT